MVRFTSRLAGSDQHCTASAYHGADMAGAKDTGFHARSGTHPPPIHPMVLAPCEKFNPRAEAILYLVTAVHGFLLILIYNLYRYTLTYSRKNTEQYTTAVGDVFSKWCPNLHFLTSDVSLSPCGHIEPNPAHARWRVDST